MTKQPSNQAFTRLYDKHCKHLALHDFADKTIDAYSRAIRRIGKHFNYEITALTQDQLLDYFSALLKTHAMSTVKLDLYGLRFFYQTVLKRDWVDIPVAKSARVVRIPNIITIEEAQQLFMTTRILSYRVFFCTVYSMGLRLSEGLALKVGDIDGIAMRVHIRNSKGNKDRFVPIAQSTLLMLRRFWKVHQHPYLLFPKRRKKLSDVRTVTTTLERGGLQKAMKQVTHECGFKKTLHCTAYVIAMPPI